MRSRRASTPLLLLAILVLQSPPPAANASPAASAALLVAQGRQREAEGDQLLALKRYSDAIDMDPTSEEAYLALGGLRTRRGELVEADQVYTIAIARIPTAIDSVVGRARVRRKMGSLEAAAVDLGRARDMLGLAATPREIAVLHELAEVRREQKEPAAELSVWRRILSVARRRGDEPLAKEASVQVRALGIFVGDVDPALRGRGEADPERRALAAIARRGG